MRAQLLRIDFRNHERHVRVHPVVRTFVDDETPRLHRIRGQRPSHRAARGEKRHVDAGEPAQLSFLDRIGFPRTDHSLSRRPRRGKEPQRSHGEVARMQELKQLLTDSARGADDTDIDGSDFHE